MLLKKIRHFVLFATTNEPNIHFVRSTVSRTSLTSNNGAEILSPTITQRRRVKWLSTLGYLLRSVNKFVSPCNESVRILSRKTIRKSFLASSLFYLFIFLHFTKRKSLTLRTVESLVLDGLLFEKFLLCGSVFYIFGFLCEQRDIIMKKRFDNLNFHL